MEVNKADLERLGDVLPLINGAGKKELLEMSAELKESEPFLFDILSAFTEILDGEQFIDVLRMVLLVGLFYKPTSSGGQPVIQQDKFAKLHAQKLKILSELMENPEMEAPELKSKTLRWAIQEFFNSREALKRMDPDTSVSIQVSLSTAIDCFETGSREI